MRRALIALLAALGLALGGCGGSSSDDDGPLRNADDITSQQAEANSEAGELGKKFDLDGNTSVVLSNPTVDNSNNSQSNSLSVDIRVENNSKDTGTTPKVAIRCAGNPHDGEYFANSTLLMGQPLPAKSYKEGTYVLELPSSDGNYSPFAPECKTPAYLAVRSGTIVVVGDVHEVRVPLADDTVAELNAGASS